MIIKCYKGAKDSDITSIDIPDTTCLKEVRKILTEQGFITADTDKEAYRFAIKQTEQKKTILKDIVVPIEFEDMPPVSRVWGYDKQIVLTNINSAPSADLVGFACDRWYNRYASAACKLNWSDPAAIEKNNKIGAFEPMMLTDVIPTNEMSLGYYENVCICLEGSAVQFHISSWGAAGFHFQIAPQAGDPIVSGLYRTFNDTPNRYGECATGCWQKKGKTIEIYAFDHLEGLASGSRTRYQRITFKTRNLISYKRGDRTYHSDAEPPSLVPDSSRMILVQGNFVSENDNRRALATASQKENVIVDGDSYTAGTAIQGGESVEKHGSIGSCVTDSWENALGAIVVHFFVFKSKEEALNTIQGLNSLDPDLWK